MPYEPSIYIEQYLRLRFLDSSGNYVSNAGGIGQDMIFSNREIKEDLSEFAKYEPNIFQTAEGKALAGVTIFPLRWDFTINLELPVTYQKMKVIDDNIRQGLRAEATILAGYQTYDGAGGMTAHVPGIATISRAVISYSQHSFRQIGRGQGTRRFIQLPISILESFDPVIVSTGGGAGGGGGA